MVPKGVGREVARRRMLLGLTQREVAEQIATTRAYVSAIERGVDWDPDIEKLVALAKVLGWEEEHLLARLGRRVSLPVLEVLTPDVVREVRLAVAEGVRDGMRELLHQLGVGESPRPAAERPRRTHHELPA